MLKHYNITVSGKVQGVFFRASAQKKAGELGISGFVKNLENGSVCMEAEGEKDALEKFIEWCHVGPPNATVSEIKASEGFFKSFNGFEIKR